MLNCPFYNLFRLCVKENYITANVEAVQGIGIEESRSLAGGQQAADTAQQADADGDGERADHHGEGKLDAAGKVRCCWPVLNHRIKDSVRRQDGSGSPPYTPAG